MAKFGFDPSEVDVNAQGSFEPMEPGDYVLKATGCEEKNTKAGGGVYIAATFEVAEGEFKGRKVWMNFNIVNKSEKAQSIGRQQLVAWATAAGKANATDTDHLIDRKFTCTLGIETQEGFKPSNVIKSFLFDLDAGAPAASKSSATEAPEVAVKRKPAAPAPAPGKAKTANPWD
jgi:hypothetical protein